MKTDRRGLALRAHPSARSMCSN